MEYVIYYNIIIAENFNIEFLFRPVYRRYKLDYMIALLIPVTNFGKLCSE
jgi:hypothetical protein